jgi:SRSO17 transposase
VGHRATVQELKDELGLDHFEGRSLPGWQRHFVLTALAYSFSKASDASATTP